MEKKLIHRKDGRTVHVGDEVTNSRGEKAIVTDVGPVPPRGKSGKISVRFVDENPPAAFAYEYYVSVFGLERVDVVSVS